MTERDAKLERARAHMTTVAKGLVAALGPDAALATLAGALTRILLDMSGQEAAVEYLRMLAVEIDAPSTRGQDREPTDDEEAELDAAIERATDRIERATEEAAAHVVELQAETEISELERLWAL
jgi:hypothetical protein